jgi:hypothetical protein
MQANPDKFQVLTVGKKTYEKRPTINIQNFELTCEDGLEFFSVQKCQTKGQKLKLLRIKVWKIVSLFNLFK